MLISDETTSREVICSTFNSLENQLLDKREISLNFEKINFISVYFLERLENFVNKAKSLDVKIQIINVHPSVYKVFQVSRIKDILNTCV
ncbi:MAG: hypothetical protein HYY52_05345 [Candidatus Melainabacteria bacterium]|nr:hypothetical protein [Candidatus Melainabacteria bacterium]